jgi:hypothetical protein
MNRCFANTTKLPAGCPAVPAPCPACDSITDCATCSKQSVSFFLFFLFVFVFHLFISLGLWLLWEL